MEEATIIDEKEFFREATLRICGSLEIEKALWQAFLYLRSFIPADVTVFNIYDPGLGIVETVASANEGEGLIMSLKTPIPQAIRKMIEEGISNPETIPLVLILERMSEFPISAPVAKTLNVPNDASALVIRLRLEGKLLGTLVFINTTGKRYSQEHARLLTLLNEPLAIAFTNYLRYREVSQLKELLADDNRYLHDEIRRRVGDEIVGTNFGLKGVMDLVRHVATLSSPVLLLGETGVGKEVIARAIHNLSLRRDGPFININCGAIPETLVDSELFGHERGAFTGALSQKRGRFERAHRGTIFLDEIGELRSEAQVRLLRVLQEKEIERVGGTSPIKVDIRIIAATHRNLETMQEEGKFREDLYFRLNVFPIVIQPLRDRSADIPALVHHFIQKKVREMVLPYIPTLAPGAIDRLINYHWPGNVRELENAVERALILSHREPLTFEDLGTPMQKGSEKKTSRITDNSLLNLDQAIIQHILRALEITQGKVGGEEGAARLLEINPSTLRKKMRKLGIPFGRKVRSHS